MDITGLHTIPRMNNVYTKKSFNLITWYISAPAYFRQPTIPFRTTLTSNRRNNAAKIFCNFVLRGQDTVKHLGKGYESRCGASENPVAKIACFHWQFPLEGLSKSLTGSANRLHKKDVFLRAWW